MKNINNIDRIKDIKTNKTQLIWEVNNDMCHNFYYMVYVRIYSTNLPNHWKGFRFIVWFDINDVCEFYDKDRVTKKEIAEYKNEWINSADYPTDYNNTANFLNWCNETIRRYNKMLGY